MASSRRYRLFALILAVSVVGGCCLCRKDPQNGGSEGNTGSGPLRAGAAVVPIAFDPGTPLAGFGGAPRRNFGGINVLLNLLALGGACFDPDPADPATFFEPAMGQHDPLAARALVLDNGVRKLALVKVDAIAASRKLRADILKQSASLGIADEDFTLVATHTHSGPGALSEYPLYQVAGSDCFSDAVYDKLLTGAAEALAKADEALVPARYGFGAVQVLGANKNRRGRPEVVDRELAVLKITTTDQKPLAVLFNFAVHGTSFGQSNMAFSADCMGAMESVVETGLPGAIAIFTNAAEGDVAPQHNGATGIQTMGNLVGSAVLSLWTSIPTKTDADLAGSIEYVDMPAPRFNLNGSGVCFPVPGTSGDICSLLGLSATFPVPSSWVPTRLPFQALRIDDTVLVAVPGEPITEIGQAIKQTAIDRGFSRALVLGLANDHGGYFTTRDEYVRGEYEGRSTAYGEDTGAIVVDSADDVITQVIP